MPLKIETLEDDPVGVPDDAILYRRVDWDQLGGRDRCLPGEVATLSGNAFSDYDEERALASGYPAPCMSVAVASILEEQSLGAAQLLVGHDGYGIAKVKAGDLRNLRRLNGDSCPQGVMLAPEEDEPWHAVVFDLEGGGRKKAVKKQIAAIAEWVIPLVNE